MKHLVSVIVLNLFLVLGFAQATQTLLPCPTKIDDTYWSDCVGSHIDAEGNKYVGEFKKGKFNGQGTYSYGPRSKFPGDKYIGEFKNGVIHGQGTYTWANGYRYIGEFRAQKPHGHGTFIHANGDKYSGDIKNGEFSGEGTYTYGPKSQFAGDRYIGQFKKNQPNGQGTYLYADGARYTGAIRNGEANGLGTYVHANGEKYVGEFKNDVKHGYGTYTWTNGNKYVGDFRNDKLEGLGIYRWANGNRYVGEIKNSVRHGRGVFTSANGRVLEGIWENGEFKYPKRISSQAALGKIPQAERTGKTRSPRKSVSSASGFFVSARGHVVTNNHAIDRCRKVTFGFDTSNQFTAKILKANPENDLALLTLSRNDNDSSKVASLLHHLDHRPQASLSINKLRSEDVELGEDILVAGYPYGAIFGNSIKVTKGVVSAIQSQGEGSGLFQLDAAAQPGSSGGPIYDDRGNVVGMVVAQLDKMKTAREIGFFPENVNFAVKASAIRQFLASAGIESQWPSGADPMSTKSLAKIAKSTTVMVMCQR